MKNAKEEKRYMVIDSKGMGLEFMSIYWFRTKKDFADVAEIHSCSFGTQALVYKKKYIADFIAELLNDEPNTKYTNDNEIKKIFKKNKFKTDDLNLPVKVIEVLAVPGKRFFVADGKQIELNLNELRAKQ